MRQSTLSAENISSLFFTLNDKVMPKPEVLLDPNLQTHSYILIWFYQFL